MLPFLFLLIAGEYVNAQFLSASSDSIYYRTYPKQVTGRFYFSKKYTGLALEASGDTRTLKYRPNTTINAGIGATYGIVTLNLGFRVGFLTPDKKEKGKTKLLDLQSHIYSRKLLIDLYGQFYKGFFVDPKGYGTNQDAYYQRPDVNVNLVGASVYRLLNPNRFSYRAAFLQNEWQKKSAGSFLVGAEIYSGSIKGDSALIPAILAEDYSQAGVRKGNFTEFGPGIGYAYTAVFHRNFFLTGSFTLNADLSFVKEYGPDFVDKRTTISPNINLRAVAGYNSDVWSATISWIDNSINLKGQPIRDQYLVNAGNIRLTLAKRFRPGKRVVNKLKLIENAD